MSKIIKDLKISIDEDLDEKLQWLMPNYQCYHILKKSIDARKRGQLHFVYSLELFAQGEDLVANKYLLEKKTFKGQAPIIIGAGPAGLFAALRFVEQGIPCHLFERGSESGKRMKGITRFWRYGELDSRNNVCFGEGGAGLFSDGKLITRIKSPHIPYVLQRLVQFGAPEEILYLSNPHVGSDKIRRVIPKIREYLIANGCTVHFDSQVCEILTQGEQIVGVQTEHKQKFASEHVILATGHSAEDMFHHLSEIGVAMEGKSFAVGLRIEHPQKIINKIQYKEFAEHPKLGAANYKLAYHNKKENIGVYSFCMCPGGYILSSGTDNWGLVCNGMSNFNRNSPFANAAVVISIDHEKNFGKNIFGGLEFRKNIEKKALQMVHKSGGTKQLPAQKVVDFINKKQGDCLKSSSLSGVVPARLDQLLPENLLPYLFKGLEKFNQSMPGFTSELAQLHGVESRTSCPIRITRDKESLESISHKGLYPTGEGAGYAGGITSAACDGIRVADIIASKF